MRLWHFTCDHGFAGLGSRGVLKPNPHPLMPELGPVIWLTDDPAPERDDVGLTSETGLLKCDRMEYRYRVDTDEAVRWVEVEQRVANRQVVWDLESYAHPETWWLLMAEAKAVLA